ncbi:putative cardiolipin synthase [Variovorax sp. TBS-050B]|uniref:phospholipase D-like domain-containing protein n=1 Tax=Variovorax sp. TBS-050B TaxID=2940551 RepID=UPI00247661EE|nr:phospholipase D family protein [Variovorax sp. TBS-050B]MDH6590204.1 putative cardiolipin synthase [Variovorax sp. TBS-050B]
MRLARLLAALVCLPLAGWLAGCASGLPARERTPVQWALAPAHDGALGRLAAAPPPGAAPSDAAATRVQPLVEAPLALDARLALIRNAQSSIDLQTYYLGNDATGALILRELQQAARRGVRVRLLLDDFHTAGRDPWLLALEREPFAHVRLFNPFFGRQRNPAQRLFAFVADFSRLTHRMHNKLMVADGVLAIAGGRNVADEYFLRAREANFIDLEVLLGGALVAELQSIFDLYWNSDLAYGIEQVTHASAAEAVRPIEAQGDAAGHEDVAPGAAHPPRGAWVSAQIEQGASSRWLAADAGAVADPPDRRPGAAAPHCITARERMAQLVESARESYELVTPYFIPDAAALAQIERLRARGVQVSIATNGMADTDEPIVNTVYNRFRRELLARGVRLFEVSARQIGRSRPLRQRFGDSKGRLHAKLAIIDRRTVLLGSVNFDPRSARLNTELGVRIRSEEVARRLRDALHMDSSEGVYEVVLDPDTRTLRWVSNGPEREVLDEEPGVGLLFRLRMLWLSWLVPLDQL